jgi:hypothetical protein
LEEGQGCVEELVRGGDSMLDSMEAKYFVDKSKSLTWSVRPKSEVTWFRALTAPPPNAVSPWRGISTMKVNNPGTRQRQAQVSASICVKADANLGLEGQAPQCV